MASRRHAQALNGLGSYQFSDDAEQIEAGTIAEKTEALLATIKSLKALCTPVTEPETA
jgi:hypothetical protein